MVKFGAFQHIGASKWVTVQNLFGSVAWFALTRMSYEKECGRIQRYHHHAGKRRPLGRRHAGAEQQNTVPSDHYYARRRAI